MSFSVHSTICPPHCLHQCLSGLFVSLSTLSVCLACLSVSLCVCLVPHLTVCLPASLSIWSVCFTVRSFFLSASVSGLVCPHHCLSASLFGLSACLVVCLSGLPASQSVCLPRCLSASLIVCLSALLSGLSACLAVYLLPSLSGLSASLSGLSACLTCCLSASLIVCLVFLPHCLVCLPASFAVCLLPSLACPPHCICWSADHFVLNDFWHCGKHGTVPRPSKCTYLLATDLVTANHSVLLSHHSAALALRHSTVALAWDGAVNINHDSRVVKWVGRSVSWNCDLDSCVIIGGSCHQYFCRDKCSVATNACLSRQTILSRQAYFYRDKHVFVTTIHVFCRDKSMLVANRTFVATFVATEIFCHDKHNFVATKTFVTASIFLSRQKTCFVATKMILVAAPANDSVRRVIVFFRRSVVRQAWVLLRVRLLLVSVLV